MRLGRTSSIGTVGTVITVGSNAPIVTLAHLWRLSTLTAILEMKQTMSSNEDFTELGVTEKIVADKFSSTITAIKDSAQQLLEVVEKLEGTDWSAVMLDSDKKKTMAPFLQPMEKLAANLGQSLLIPTLLDILSKPKD